MSKEKTVSPEAIAPSENGAGASAMERAPALLAGLDSIAETVREAQGFVSVVEDVREILYKDQILVREAKCLRCNAEQGHPHTLGACTAVARVEEARERINQP